MDQILAIPVALIMVAHFVFISYVVVGGFLALRWRPTIWLHVAAVLWGVASAVGHVGCPLTGMERWARNQAGMAPLPSKGFIAHYITGVMYPVTWAAAVQAVVFAIVAVSWTAYVWDGRRRDVAAPRADPPISANDEL